MRILVYIHYLEIGGAERALIGMLNAIDPSTAQVDLLLNQHTGEFMDLIPEHINVLPEMPEYSAIERPIRQIVSEGHIGIAIRRLIGKYRHAQYVKHNPLPEGKIDESIFQYIFRSVTPGLRDLSHLGVYDLAISFLHPHNIVLDKVKARKKICWVHTDYSTVRVNHDLELPVWGGYDRIAAISDEASRAFADEFPELKDKMITVENILSPDAIRLQAQTDDVSHEMPDRDGEIKILSVGRFCPAKRFDDVPRICRQLLDRGLKFRWYIVGFGNDSVTRANIDRYNVADTLILLGKKGNPYPYINACDIYAQPSLYEGKSVTVREAQILCKPVVISSYPTAPSQVNDGIDGIIAPLAIDGFADGLYTLAIDIRRQNALSDYLAVHDYGNTGEIKKIVSN